jgi:predicted MFS family arabinose efflux permease
VPGAVTVTLGLLAVIFGITRAESEGWTGTSTLVFLGVGLVLLAFFVVIESRSPHPLLPLRILANRNRGGAYLASFFIGVGLFAIFLFLSYFFQGVLGYSPLESGLLFLPLTAGIIVSAGITSRLLPITGPRFITGGGFALTIVGLLLLQRMSENSTYVGDILPSMILVGLGIGFVFVPLSATALFGVGDADAGVASAVLNAAQQVGGSVGVAFLNTIATSATTAYIVANQLPGPNGAALVEGFTTGFLWSAAILLVAGVIWIVLVTMTGKDMADDEVNADRQPPM